MRVILTETALPEARGRVLAFGLVTSQAYGVRMARALPAGPAFSVSDGRIAALKASGCAFRLDSLWRLRPDPLGRMSPSGAGSCW